MLFFFQAEDGIRDLVRSRGLGDVYKRQEHTLLSKVRAKREEVQINNLCVQDFLNHHLCKVAVSYTHLTLPTSDLV